MSGSWGISPSRIRSLILASSRLICFSTCYGVRKYVPKAYGKKSRLR